MAGALLKAGSITNRVNIQGPLVATASSVSGPVTSGIEFRTDGTIYEIDNVTGDVQIGTWWSGAPQAGIGSKYDVRVTSTTGTWDTAAASEGTYIQMSANREWSATRNVGGEDNVSTTFEVSRTGAGSALSSLNGSVNAEVVV